MEYWKTRKNDSLGLAYNLLNSEVLRNQIIKKSIPAKGGHGVRSGLGDRCRGFPDSILISQE